MGQQDLHLRPLQDARRAAAAGGQHVGGHRQHGGQPHGAGLPHEQQVGSPRLAVHHVVDFSGFSVQGVLPQNGGCCYFDVRWQVGTTTYAYTHATQTAQTRTINQI